MATDAGPPNNYWADAYSNALSGVYTPPAQEQTRIIYEDSYEYFLKLAKKYVMKCEYCGGRVMLNEPECASCGAPVNPHPESKNGK